MQNFDVLKVPLKGSNLIEASAGTGKTYSIGILVLRLLLEKGVTLPQILMVTFTESAVAELQERIRRFVRQAHDYANNSASKVDDESITSIVDLAKQSDEAACLLALKDALALLDEVAIYTIHGFCSRTLKEFAFETNQLFDKEILIDQKQLVESAINDYWRNEVTTLPLDLLDSLKEIGLDRTTFTDLVRKVLGGRVFEDDFTEDPKEAKEQVEDLGLTLQRIQKELVKLAKEHWDEVLAGNKKIKGTKDRPAEPFTKVLNDADSFVEDYLKLIRGVHPFLKLNGVFRKFPKPFMEEVGAYEQILEEQNKLLICTRNTIYRDAANAVKVRIEAIKEEKSLQSFDDLIQNLHQVLSSERSANLAEKLQEKYKSVFIDEFQDTDKLQYDIFYNAFRTENSDSTLFYIGDPKQSIYAFRQADIETYKKSRDGSNSYTMKTNFRSTAKYVAAMNQFFNLDTNFFSDDKIKYQNIEASSQSVKLGELQNGDGEPVCPLVFLKTEKKDDQQKVLVGQVLELLHDQKIVSPSGERKVRPSDIGVIVRSKSSGASIKELLNQKGVSAVVVDDTKVLKTPEAKYVQYILEGILHGTRNTVNRALLTPLTGAKIDDIASLDMLAELTQFKRLHDLYLKHGVYHALMTFFDWYNVNGVVLAKEHGVGDRSLSNLYQVAEICNQRVLEEQLDLEKLITWLIKERQNPKDTNEGFEQRIESDEDAVNIVTIHKSKGLAYNIVVSESLQLKSKIHDILEYQNEHSGEYAFSLNTKDVEKATWYQNQNEKENRRLMYVTLTRAVYKSIVVLNTGSRSGNKDTFMNHLFPVLETQDGVLFNDADPELELPIYEKEKEVLNGKVKTVQNFSYYTNSWSLVSYSSISGGHGVYSPKINDNLTSEYDEFVFKQMPRGKGLGNFLHYLFENVDFTSNEQHETWVKRGEQLFGRSIVNDKNEGSYLQLINEVLSADLEDKTGEVFQLSSITREQKLTELEFYFSIEELKRIAIEANFDKPVLLDKESYKGFMHGFIDLVFKHNGKYYILDWKSNFLGDHTDAYNPDCLEDAMSAANYHLQYWVYTEALTRYLKQQIPDFSLERDFGGVFYLFLRGCRTGKTNGVFYWNM